MVWGSCAVDLMASLCGLLINKKKNKWGFIYSLKAYESSPIKKASS
jgi:hypothetical protein